MITIKHIVLTLLVLGLKMFSVAGNQGVRIYTDREVYVSGNYSLLIVYPPLINGSNLAHVSLTEIGGKRISDVKLHISENHAAGCIYLPDSLHTGSYFLMYRSSEFNAKPQFCKEIFVLNRFEDKKNSFDLERADLPQFPNNESDQIALGDLKSVYHRREQVSFNLEIEEPLKSELVGNVAVVISEFIPNWKSEYLPMEAQSEVADLSGHLQGVTLQGKVINKINLLPVKEATVLLSMSDSIPYLDYFISKEDGIFRFQIENFIGAQSFVLQASKLGLGDSLKLVLDQPNTFCPFDVKTKRIAPNTTLEQLFSKAIDLVNLMKLYHFQELQFENARYQPNYSFPFYGKVEYRVDPDLYFELPDFQSISKELIAHIRFRETDNQISLRMLNKETSEFFTKTPLITVDGVPISDPSVIAKMGSKQIDWIDVIPYHRYFGDLDFSGVLAIYTKEKNGSQIIESDCVLKLPYETFQQNFSINIENKEAAYNPQFNQVLFWQPKLDIDEKIHFYTSDIKGSFQVLVVGRKKNGELVEARKVFQVN